MFNNYIQYGKIKNAQLHSSWLVVKMLNMISECSR